MTKQSAAGNVPSLGQEFYEADFGDYRLTQRLVSIVDAAERAPSAGFPKQAGSAAALEGTYRFLNNPEVAPEAILEPHFNCTSDRAAELDLVLVVHDTSEIEIDRESVGDDLGWLTPSRRGFLLHASLCVSADGLRRPLGLLALNTVFRPAFARRENVTPAEKLRIKKAKGIGTDLNGEARRWSDGATEAASRLGNCTQAIHVMDREGDSYALLAGLLDKSLRFVIRVNHDRAIRDEALPDGNDSLFARLSRPTGKFERTVRISARKSPNAGPKAKREHPERRERLAELSFSATTITLRRPRHRSSALPEELTLNFVRVWEPDPPEGQEPVEWRLVTTEPIESVDQIAAAVDRYRARWIIEEFFKALKTGTAYQKRQFESRRAMLNALAVLGPVAWRLLALRATSRDSSETPATRVLTEVQVKILKAIVKKRKLNIKLSRVPTVREAMLAIAALGGHIKYNGPPGWQTLGAGMDYLLVAELGWWLHADLGKK